MCVFQFGCVCCVSVRVCVCACVLLSFVYDYTGRYICIDAIYTGKYALKIHHGQLLILIYVMRKI